MLDLNDIVLMKILTRLSKKGLEYTEDNINKEFKLIVKEKKDGSKSTK